MSIMNRAVKSQDTRFVNPYNHQGPTNPKYYANRHTLLSTFMQNVIAVSRSKGVTRPINIAILGSWGVGKTSTLLKFRDMLKEQGDNIPTFSAVISLKPTCCTDADTFSLFIIESIFREYESSAEISDKVRDFIKNELNIIEKWKISKISMKPEIERREAPPIKSINFKETMIKFWERLLSSGIRMGVIMIDDIQYTLITNHNGELLYDLRTDMQALASSGAQFMFVIAGPMNLYPEIRDKAEPFTRLFERFDLEPFDVAGVRELIEKPLIVENIHLAIDENVISKICQITGGHPYFVTLAMRDILDHIKGDRLDLAQFNQLCPVLLEHFGRIKFKEDLNSITDAEKTVLLQMAVMDDGDISPSSLKGKGVTVLLERLVKKELVVKISRGKYRLYNPLFKEYLKQIQAK